MPNAFLARRIPWAAILALAAALPCAAQEPPRTPPPTPNAPSAHHAPRGGDDVAAFARLALTVAQARDSAQKQLAFVRNKTPQMQQQLRDQLATRIAEILRQAGTTDDEFRRRMYVLSTDTTARLAFDQATAQLTGAPVPGRVVTAGAVDLPIPAGAAGTHVAHVARGFPEAPSGQGLLATAFAEARTAAQHAALATRDLTNLDAIKLHAGHVAHAVDPTAVTAGPGLGYGVKRAALGVATHIDLAAKAEGASPELATHAGHVAVAARNTVQRADAILSLVTRIQAATTADAASSLASQLVALTTELTAGKDADADGRTSWKEGEGGLQHCEEHVRLMLAAPKP